MRTIKISIAVIMLFTFAATGQEPVPNPYSPAKTAGVRMPDNTKVCSPGTEPTTGKVLKFDGTCWDSGTDNTGGGGGSLTVEEADGNPSVANVEALQFNQASGFSVVDEEAGQVQVNFTITDSLVPNDITASNYCALGGCTFVGNVIFGNLGFTGTASDTNPTCEEGDYRIYADDSETKWKKCQDGVLSDLDTDTDTDTDALVDLTGVSISDPSDGQILQYGSGVWGNVTPPFQPSGTYSGTGSCDPNEVVTGLNDGSAPTCSALGDSDIPNDITIDNATTADALSADPDPCEEGDFVKDMAADGTLTCDTPAGGGGGAEDLDDLTDVAITTPEDGQILQYATDTWVNGAPPFLKNTGTLDDGEFCVWLSSSSHLNCNVPLGSLPNLNTLLGGINIVDTGTRTNGRICTWDASGTEIDCDTTNAPTATAADSPPAICDQQIAIGVDENWDAVCVDNAPAASDVSFDNSETDFESDNVEDALKELNGSVVGVTINGTESIDVVPTGDPVTDLDFVFNYANHAPSDDVALGADECVFGANGILCEGSVADTVETLFLFPDLTSEDANRTYALVPASFTEGHCAEFDSAGQPVDSGDVCGGGGGGATSIPFFNLRPQANEPPASNFATIFARNGHPGLSFDGDVCAVWTFVLPNTYGGGGVTVDFWSVSSATSGDIDWDGSWERISTTQDIDSDSFATAVSANNNNNNGTSGIPTKVSIAFTDGAQMDSCAAGELCRFRLCRDESSDTTAATNGAAVLLGGDVYETPAP